MVAGDYTLPVIPALADPKTGRELAPLLGGPLDESSRDQAREIVRGSGRIAAAVTVAREWADNAAAALSVPPPPDRSWTSWPPSATA